MNFKKLDLLFSIALLLNAIRAGYMLASGQGSTTYYTITLIISLIAAIVLFLNSRRSKTETDKP